MGVHTPCMPDLVLTPPGGLLKVKNNNGERNIAWQDR